LTKALRVWALALRIGSLQMTIGSPFLNRHVDDVALFSPTSVVVLLVVQAEQIAQHDPSVAGTLADAAIRHRRLLSVNALLLEVNRLQFVRRLEGAILLHGGAPRNALGAGDMPAALRGLSHARRRDDLAAEFVRAAHIHEVRFRSEEHTSELQSP